MTASVGGYFCLHVMVLHSGMLLMFDRMLGVSALMPSGIFPPVPTSV
jgi:hypothetical protein